MKRLTRLRPSPAMIVACAALFVALGGVGYAAATIGSAQIKNNSVQGKDVKNNSLTGKDVKNSSLGGSDVKNNRLTGSDILESSLGKVPSAGTADTADTANTANSANTASSSNTTHGLGNFPLKRADAAATFADAPEVTLGRVGQFEFYGKCYLAAAKVQADEYIKLLSGSAVFNTEDSDGSGGSYLTPTTAETDRLVEANAGAAVDTVNVEDADADFRATDGNIAITGVIGLAASKQGNPVDGNGPFGPGDACLFGGSVFGG